MLRCDNSYKFRQALQRLSFVNGMFSSRLTSGHAPRDGDLGGVTRGEKAPYEILDATVDNQAVLTRLGLPGQAFVRKGEAKNTQSLYRNIHNCREP
jgi:hypothetical protein